MPPQHGSARSREKWSSPSCRPRTLPFMAAVLLTATVVSACGPRRIITSADPVRDTVATTVEQWQDLGSVVLVDVINWKPAGSDLGFRLLLGGEHDRSFKFQPSEQLWCDLRVAVHDAFRERGVSAPSAVNRTWLRSRGSPCGELRGAAREEASLQGDVILGAELLDVAWNERRNIGFRVAAELPCDAEAWLRWRVQALGAESPSYLSETKSRFTGRCRAETPVDGIRGAVRVGVLQLLADSTFLAVLEASKGAARDRRVAFEERQLADSIAGARAEEEAETERVRREEEAAEQKRVNEDRRQADLRAAEEASAALWGRPAPAPGTLVEINPRDRNPVTRGPMLERVRPAVVTLEGPTGSGTAFILSRDGLALTNLHVVERAGSPLVARFADGGEAQTRVLRVSDSPDVALIQVLCNTACNTVSLATSDPTLGQDLYVVGAPLGFEFSVSRGVASSMRFIDGATYLQTDAASNPGNSGGPVLDVETGAVFGILTFGIKESEGLNFALSVLDAVRALGLRVR